MKRITLSYIAGAIEHRGTITENPLRVSLRTRGPLPKQLKKMFGGTSFTHDGKNWFRIQNKKAEILLRRILPFLRMDKNKVRRLLQKRSKNG